MPGPGLVLATAEKLQTASGAENPDAFDFENSDPWGAITIALRQTSVTKKVFGRGKDANVKNRIITPMLTLQDGAILDNVVVEGDVFDVDGEDMDNVLITGDLEIQTAGTYDFNDVIVMGDVTNSDTLGNVTINVSGQSSVTTSEPGTGNGQVNILNSVDAQVTVLDDTDSSGINLAHVYLETVSGGTEVMNGATNASGVITAAFNYLTDTPVVGWARQMDLSGTDYEPKDISGTITSSGFVATVRLTPLT